MSSLNGAFGSQTPRHHLGHHGTMHRLVVTSQRVKRQTERKRKVKARQRAQERPHPIIKKALSLLTGGWSDWKGIGPPASPPPIARTPDPKARTARTTRRDTTPAPQVEINEELVEALEGLFPKAKAKYLASKANPALSIEEQIVEALHYNTVR
jgi:hypothetical protein